MAHGFDSFLSAHVQVHVHMCVCVCVCMRSRDSRDDSIGQDEAEGNLMRPGAGGP
ncbi:hypothetical protein BN940_02731 [Castellaniella defragrans 65Phen]|uniref:Uncharacterized protein n=1 Tax=Castellaniella defragrans (strain DSM 12143 / CCUG 39792 / 65Phen) TaxID=1437824 RepID=W8X159_CASD6|nr:hypothetical protein BN940_02731 [Castellaniella defragrans 65Phen]